MAFNFIAGTSAGSADSHSITTSEIDTTLADLIVVHVSCYNADPILDDFKLNTWTGLTLQGSTSSRSRLFYCVNPIVGTNHWFRASTGTTYPSVSVVAVRGSKSSPLDQQNGVYNGGTVNSTQTGSITPSENDCLVVTGVNDYGTSALIDSGFTAIVTDYSAGNHLGGAIAYKIQTIAAAVNPTWSWTGSPAEVAATIASFKTAVHTGDTISNLSISDWPELYS